MPSLRAHSTRSDAAAQLFEAIGNQRHRAVDLGRMLLPSISNMYRVNVGAAQNPVVTPASVHIVVLMGASFGHGQRASALAWS